MKRTAFESAFADVALSLFANDGLAVLLQFEIGFLKGSIGQRHTKGPESRHIRLRYSKHGGKRGNKSHQNDAFHRGSLDLDEALYNGLRHSLPRQQSSRVRLTCTTRFRGCHNGRHLEGSM